ncbi:MAG TPA: HD domain-containing phosphohydrolase, partial [Abditibacteriaceae bacterium]
LSLGQGYAGRAALERNVIAIADLQETPGGFTASPFLAQEKFIGYYAVPLIAKGEVKGVLEVFQRSVADVETEWLGFLQILAGQAAIAIDNATLFDDLQRSNAALILAYDTTLEGWSRALDLRDRETEGHTLRVTELALQLARALGLSDEELIHVRRGALLHDIGKMGVPDGILLKPGPLTDDEWISMRRHPTHAFELLSPIEFLQPALDIPHYHHEKWDGSGYPHGLRGEEIPLTARLFAVVDVWDALRSNRPYRTGWPVEKVREQICKDSGTHFDPRIVEAFLQLDLA